MKLAGREAGSYCVVVKPAGTKKEDKSFVFVTGPKLLTGVKRRKCNIDHLKATEYKLEIKEDVSDEEVIAAYEKAGLITKLNLKKPSAAQIKMKEEKAKKKETGKKVEKRTKKKESAKKMPKETKKK